MTLRSGNGAKARRKSHVGTSNQQASSGVRARVLLSARRELAAVPGLCVMIFLFGVTASSSTRTKKSCR